MIIPNIWKMMRDDRFYPSPEEFSPDRFLSQRTSLVDDDQGDEPEANDARDKDNADDPSAIAYGFGRRICPGRFVADATLWLAMANVLAVFNMRAVEDPVTGKPDIPAAEYISGVTTHPKPFKCIIAPRSEKHVAVIEAGRQT